MTFQYPPIPNHDEVDAIGNQFWKMSRDEYMILFDVVKRATEDRVGEIELCQLGAGEGASTAVMLMASANMRHGYSHLFSVDIKEAEETEKALEDLGDRGYWNWFLTRFRVTSRPETTQEFRKLKHPFHYVVTLVDADHEHDAASADINWAVNCSEIVIAHDLDQKDIARICQRAADASGKNLLSINKGISTPGIGHGLAIIY